MLGDRPGAELDLKRAARLLPQDFDAHYYLGRVYFEGSKLTLALSAFRKAIELDPRSAKARNHLGQTLEGLDAIQRGRRCLPGRDPTSKRRVRNGPNGRTTT